jgi:hypothetical protein
VPGKKYYYNKYDKSGDRRKFGRKLENLVVDWW